METPPSQTKTEEDELIEPGSSSYSNLGTRINHFRNYSSVFGDSQEDLHSIFIDDRQNLFSSARRRVLLPNDKIKPGALNVLSANYESLDYEICENHFLLNEERQLGYRYIVLKVLSRWFVFCLIGVATALVACAIDISIERLSLLKYAALSKSVDVDALKEEKLFVPYLMWLALNLVPVFIGATLVACVEPIAAGSGIPQVKCYLNGVNIPRVVRIKTLFVKSVGVVCSVVGGLAGGKEGPMIHSGAVIGAGISQGKSSSLGLDFKVFQYFREDHEKRDFVSGGAAAGVSAAFGAPMGGVLFSLEEGASFWNQSLVWKIFFASVMSTFTLNAVLSAYYGMPGIINYPGLLNLGQFEPYPYQLYEIPLFILMGACGGLSGALWNHMNYKLSVWRLRYIRKRILRIIEACLISMFTATVGFLMMYFINDCKPLGQSPTKFPTQLFCGDGQYNVMASIWFQTPEASVKSLFHDASNTHNALSLGVFVLFYHLISCLTFGLASSNGLFIPSLLTGAAWGRLFSIGLSYVLPNISLAHPGKYALIGAAAQLGGTVRMTISLTAILIETTGDISFALPLIATLIAAKWTGDFFNEGIYDIHIRLGGIPLLPWEPPPLFKNIYASEVMSHPVVTLKTIENVGHILELLRLTTYNGFPVVDPPLSDRSEIKTYGKIRGLILRSQLLVILERRLFNENSEEWGDVKTSIFRDKYPRYPTIDQVELSEDYKTYSLDLRPFMNPVPYTVLHNMSLPRMFRLFRALGLRHLPITNDVNEVVGMVTRKDLARYRVWQHHGRMGVDELLISKEL